MKILTLTQKFSGCGYHRLMLPISLMQKEYGRITDQMTEDQWDEHNYDIVFINRIWEPENLIERRKQKGFKLVVDVDDYWILSHDHLMYDGYNSSNFVAKLIHHMKEADLVTCTHERLADAIYPHNKNVEILPNAIPYGYSQFNGERVVTDAVKLFWAGGITHDQDLKLLQAPLKKLSGNVQMVMGGFADSNETERYYWYKMAGYFTADQKLTHTLIRGMDVFNYYEMFRHSDIMLVPLVKNNFNSYKSNIKLLEAAGKAIPAIVSHVDPYLGFPEDVVKYVKKSNDWLKYINELVNDKEMRNELGVLLHTYCAKYFNFNEINEKRKAAFLKLLS
jgi:hypothetical protein